MYTSGSTGYPKGVLGTHAGLINRLIWQYKLFPFEPRSSNTGDNDDDSEEGSVECSVECSDEAINGTDLNSDNDRMDYQEEVTPVVLMPLNSAIDGDKGTTTDVNGDKEGDGDKNGGDDQHGKMAVNDVDVVNSDHENEEHATVASTSEMELDVDEGVPVAPFRGEVVCRRTPVSPA